MLGSISYAPEVPDPEMFSANALARLTNNVFPRGFQQFILNFDDNQITELWSSSHQLFDLRNASTILPQSGLTLRQKELVMLLRHQFNKLPQPIRVQLDQINRRKTRRGATASRDPALVMPPSEVPYLSRQSRKWRQLTQAIIKQRKVACHLCIEPCPRFASLPSLLNHMLVEHEEACTSMFACGSCNKAFYTRESYNTHECKDGGAPSVRLGEQMAFAYGGLVCGDCGLHLRVRGENGDKENEQVGLRNKNKVVQSCFNAFTRHNQCAMRPLTVYSSSELVQDPEVHLRLPECGGFNLERKSKCPWCSKEFKGDDNYIRHIFDECSLKLTALAVLAPAEAETVRDKRIREEQSRIDFVAPTENALQEKLNRYLERVQARESMEQREIDDKEAEDEMDESVSLIERTKKESNDDQLSKLLHKFAERLGIDGLNIECSFGAGSDDATIEYTERTDVRTERFQPDPKKQEEAAKLAARFAHRARTVIPIISSENIGPAVVGPLNKSVSCCLRCNTLLSSRAALMHAPSCQKGFRLDEARKAGEFVEVYHQGSSPLASRISCWQCDHSSCSLSGLARHFVIAHRKVLTFDRSLNDKNDFRGVSVEFDAALGMPQGRLARAPGVSADDVREADVKMIPNISSVLRNSTSPQGLKMKIVREEGTYVAQTLTDEIADQPSTSSAAQPMDDGEEIEIVQEYLVQETIHVHHPQSSYLPVTGRFRYCRACNTAYPTGKAFDYHFRQLHGGLYQSCDRCSLLVQKNKIDEHMEAHADGHIRYVCVHCKLWFKEDEQYYLHCSLIHHRDLIFFCKRCSVSSKQGLEIGRHVHGAECARGDPTDTTEWLHGKAEMAICSEGLMKFAGGMTAGPLFTSTVKATSGPVTVTPCSLLDCRSRNLLASHSRMPLELRRVSCPEDYFPVNFDSYLNHVNKDKCEPFKSDISQSEETVTGQICAEFLRQAAAEERAKKNLTEIFNYKDAQLRAARCPVAPVPRIRMQCTFCTSAYASFLIPAEKSDEWIDSFAKACAVAQGSGSTVEASYARLFKSRASRDTKNHVYSCTRHIDPSEINEDGTLKASARPTYFPVKCIVCKAKQLDTIDNYVRSKEDLDRIGVKAADQQRALELCAIRPQFFCNTHLESDKKSEEESTRQKSAERTPAAPPPPPPVDQDDDATVPAPAATNGTTVAVAEEDGVDESVLQSALRHAYLEPPTPAPARAPSTESPEKRKSPNPIGEEPSAEDVDVGVLNSALRHAYLEPPTPAPAATPLSEKVLNPIREDAIKEIKRKMLADHQPSTSQSTPTSSSTATVSTSTTPPKRPRLSPPAIPVMNSQMQMQHPQQPPVVLKVPVAAPPMPQPQQKPPQHHQPPQQPQQRIVLVPSSVSSPTLVNGAHSRPPPVQHVQQQHHQQQQPQQQYQQPQQFVQRLVPVMQVPPSQHQQSPNLANLLAQEVYILPQPPQPPQPRAVPPGAVPIDPRVLQQQQQQAAMRNQQQMQQQTMPMDPRNPQVREQRNLEAQQQRARLQHQQQQWQQQTMYAPPYFVMQQGDRAVMVMRCDMPEQYDAQVAQLMRMDPMTRKEFYRKQGLWAQQNTYMHNVAIGRFRSMQEQQQQQQAAHPQQQQSGQRPMQQQHPPHVQPQNTQPQQQQSGQRPMPQQHHPHVQPQNHPPHQQQQEAARPQQQPSGQRPLQQQRQPPPVPRLQDHPPMQQQQSAHGHQASRGPQHQQQQPYMHQPGQAPMPTSQQQPPIVRPPWMQIVRPQPPSANVQQQPSGQRPLQQQHQQPPAPRLQQHPQMPVLEQQTSVAGWNQQQQQANGQPLASQQQVPSAGARSLLSRRPHWSCQPVRAESQLPLVPVAGPRRCMFCCRVAAGTVEFASMNTAAHQLGLDLMQKMVLRQQMTNDSASVIVCAGHCNAGRQLDERFATRCAPCGMFILPFEMQFHQRLHQYSTASHYCLDCNTPLGSEEDAARHMIVTHKWVPPPKKCFEFACPLTDCTKSFQSSAIFHNHLTVDHGSTLIRSLENCPTLLFQAPEALDFHKRAHEEHADPLSTCCPVCGTCNVWETTIEGQTVSHLALHSLLWMQFCRRDGVPAFTGQLAYEHFIDEDAGGQPDNVEMTGQACKNCNRFVASAETRRHANSHLITGFSMKGHPEEMKQTSRLVTRGVMGILARA